MANSGFVADNGVSVPDHVIYELDRLRHSADNATEEYVQYLDEFEADYGSKVREAYEERHV